ncbi:peptidylprolyl isomerase [Geomesophilobacter sediminis]|uniref:Peptidyl-prolyl cis-trans isomerase n=1 Tax=Geomesophilobacter sediminis TaxID=2798584 RepID=A0A8J7M4Q6_9BACT|nr:peptidylprolyl isomerase [Geomesophilobacter sediminis]MBJ6727923.1 peptidyl-prolyl cis-trans isomerase [Geomesophilobacter sediminis]
MRTLISVFAAALLVVGSGCNNKPHDAEVLARVNGIDLTRTDVSFRPDDPHLKPPEQYGAKTIDDIINEELLSQKAVQLGLDADNSYSVKKNMLDQMAPEDRRRELAKRVFNTQIAAQISVLPSEVRTFYDSHRKEIETELHLELLKFDKKEKAAQALGRIKKGANFSSVALEYGADGPQHGKSPWDLGFLRWEEIPIDFAAAIYRLCPGQTTSILGNHRTGFQIVRLVETRKGPRRDFGSVSANVANRLRDQKLLEAYLRYVNALREKARIEIF